MKKASRLTCIVSALYHRTTAVLARTPVACALIPAGGVMKRRMCHLGILAAVYLITGCGGAGSGPIDDYFTADAAVNGSVVDLAGNPLAGVDVAIYVRPGTSPFSYQ